MNAKQQQAFDRVQRRRKKLAKILKSHPDLNLKDAWHTLVLLEKPPWERLKLGLLRAQNKKQNLL